MAIAQDRRKNIYNLKFCEKKPFLLKAKSDHKMIQKKMRFQVCGDRKEITVICLCKMDFQRHSFVGVLSCVMRIVKKRKFWYHWLSTSATSQALWVTNKHKVWIDEWDDDAYNLLGSFFTSIKWLMTIYYATLNMLVLSCSKMVINDNAKLSCSLLPMIRLV